MGIMENESLLKRHVTFATWIVLLSMVLFASVSIIMEKGKIVVNRTLEDMYGENYFDIWASTKDNIGAEKYLNTMKQIEDSGYFTDVNYGIGVVGFNDKNAIYINYSINRW